MNAPATMENVRVSPELAEGMIKALLPRLENGDHLSGLMDKADFRTKAVLAVSDIITHTTMAMSLTEDAANKVLLTGLLPTAICKGDQDLLQLGRAVLEEIKGAPSFLRDGSVSEEILKARFEEIKAAL